MRSSTGDGRIPFVHGDDIADVAFDALTNAGREGAALAITGPAALSYGEMTAKIGAAIGKALRYEAISDDDARRRHAAVDSEPEVVDAHLSIYRAIREGRLSETTDVVARVLARPAITFDAWVAAHADAFR